MPHLSNQRLGVILTLAAATGFALKTILAKLAYGYGVDPVTLLTLRMAVGGSCFLSILLYNTLGTRRWSLSLGRRGWLVVAVLSFFGYYLSSLLDFSGLVYIDANLGRMILFLYPTMVVLLNSAVKRQKISGYTWLALVLCYLGILLMLVPNLGPGQNDFAKGCLLIFASALTYALYLVGVDRYFKTDNIVMFITIIMVLSAIFIMIHFLLTHNIFSLSVPVPVYLLALLMGIFSTVLPGYAISAGIAMIGASKAATISMVGPVITLALSYLILGETIGPIQVVGMVLVILGVSRVK
jgi:drug/metabolite transporter (DMT)-like permease